MFYAPPDGRLPGPAHGTGGDASTARDGLGPKAFRTDVADRDVTADVPHVFQTFAGMLDEVDDALDRAAHFLAQRLGADAVTHVPT